MPALSIAVNQSHLYLKASVARANLVKQNIEVSAKIKRFAFLKNRFRTSE